MVEDPKASSNEKASDESDNHLLHTRLLPPRIKAIIAVSVGV
jgi:hypothetical protein